MKPEKMARPEVDDAAAQATQLDHLINQRQRGDAPPPQNAEEALIDQLVHLAATTEPSAQFVAQLEQQLQHQFSAQAQGRFRVHQPVIPSVTTFSLVTSWLFQRRSVAFALALTLLLCFSLLLTTPVVRATFWDWLYGFGLISETEVAEQTIPLEAPVVPADAPRSMTLAEIQQQAPFPVHPPQDLPAGLRFTGGFVLTTESGTEVTLAYHTGAVPADGYAPDAPLLFVTISDSVLPNRPLVAEGYQQPIPIGQQIGIYTHGNWRSETFPTTPSTATDTQVDGLVWDDTLDVSWLVWQADGLDYLLYAQGLGFNAETLARVAASME